MFPRALLPAAILFAGAAFSCFESSTGWKESACADSNPTLMIQTRLGDIVVQLDSENSPRSTGNFVANAESGWFDHMLFHRVRKNFVIQTGWANSSGRKAPIQSTIPLEINPVIKHVRSAVSMARANNKPDSGNSSFSILHGDAPHLDKTGGDGYAYAAFGTVVDGMDVVDRISNVAVAGPHRSTPVEKIAMDRVFCVSL